MMQGDAYTMPIEILKADDIPLTEDEVLDVEIVIGTLCKTYSSGEVTFDGVSKCWQFPLTQEETFSFIPSKVKCQARVKWPNGNVEGFYLGQKRIYESRSKEVL